MVKVRVFNASTILVAVVGIITLIKLGDAKRVVILDTAQSSSLRWTTWTNSNSPDDGWTEESVTDIRDGVNTRSYVTCDVNKDHVDNWLRTNFIAVGEARRLSIEVKFTIRDCKLFPHTARTCKETFTLLYYESDLNFASKDKPSWSDQAYKRVDRITADSGRFTDKDNMNINVEVRSVPVTKKGVYFAFRDEGACISLLSVRVFYEVCEETVTNFAWFGETPAGPEVTYIQEAVGICVDNASPPSGVQPKYVCKADGTWDLLSGGCQCNPGYKDDGQRCIACETGHFKENPGFGLCQICPDKSNALTPGALACTCEAGYYRAQNDPKSTPCTRPPSRPEQAEIVSVEQTSAVIKWNAPTNSGGRQELWYRIECQECPTGVQYLPAKSKFNSTRLTLINLEPAVLYTVFIYAENDVSTQVNGLPMYAVVEVLTKSTSPVHVSNVKVESVSENQVTLSWDAPSMSVDYEGASASSKNAPIAGLETDLDRRRQFVQYYEIRIYPKDRPHNFTTRSSHDAKITLSGLSENSEYLIQIRPYTSKGWGAWSEPKYARTTGASSREPVSEESSQLTIGVTVMVVVLSLVGIATFLVCCRRRYSTLCSRKQASDLDTLEYKTDQTTITPDYNSAGTLHRKLTTPLVPAFNVSPFKPYVDPTTYEDPNQALKDFANEIDAGCVIIEEIIGGGEFGEVCKGQLRLVGSSEMTVAIKTLKPGSSEKARADFLTEASIMGQFNHPNVIKLKGVVTRAEPVMIITEYVENRSLDSFLRVNDGKFDALQLVSMLCGVAQGMKYLSEKGFVHRDLAARNVLVDRSLICKIADFGLSRGLDGSAEQAYTTKGGKIPVRWTAPEAIAYRKFTSSSDVWSYGVVMWEVMSYGERPYWDWTNQDVIQAIDRNYRLPPPMDCPQALHRLMLDCWHKERQYRPTFSSIVQTLNSFLQCPELLYMSSSSTSLSTPLGVSHSGDSLTNFSQVRQPSASPLVQNGQRSAQSVYGTLPGAGVEEFLRMTGLNERFAQVFRRQGINSVAALGRLTHADLLALGFRFDEQQRITDALHRWQQSTLPRRNYQPSVVSSSSQKQQQHSNDGFFV